MTNQDKNKEGINRMYADTFRIRLFLGMNPPDFTGLSVTEDSKNFVDELQKVFKVMLIVVLRCGTSCIPIKGCFDDMV